MSLLDQARTDLAQILADDENGFAWSVTVTDPDGASAELTGMFQDIGQLIDVDTGVAVSGRQVSVSLGLTSLTAAGLGVPAFVSDGTQRPWRVDVTARDGSARHYKIQDTRVDDVIGTILCFLEPYATGA